MNLLTLSQLPHSIALPAGVECGTLNPLPERVLQFGEGNFLRAFVDWMIDRANDGSNPIGSVVVVQPIERGMVDLLNKQEGTYTLLLRGIQDGKTIDQRRVITSIRRALNPYTAWESFLALAENPKLRFVVSNTTEAGIIYQPQPKPEGTCPASFPAKVAALLHRRFESSHGAEDKGLIFLPCELSSRNGDNLKEAVIHHAQDWVFGPAFMGWMERACFFANTLVDRIVPGYPKEEVDSLQKELGYEDPIMVAGEPFHLWVIEAPDRIAKEFPLQEHGLNVVWTDNLEPYRTRKVRILNGAHTMSVLGAFLAGIDTVREMMEDADFGRFMEKGLFHEIIPALDFPKADATAFAQAVQERFRNPFIRHMLLSISLNSVSKYKVRVLPTLLDYAKLKGELPPALSFGLAALIAFYKGTDIQNGALQGTRQNGSTYTIQDDAPILEEFARCWKQAMPTKDLVQTILSNSSFWGQDLNSVPHLTQTVAAYLDDILANGSRAAVRNILS